MQDINFQIIRKALDAGFSACGFSKAGFAGRDAEVLDSWLERGHNADMHWMERNLEKRKDPRMLVDNARTVISLLLNYYNPVMQEDETAPVISRYAYGKDYHRIMKKMLKEVYLFISRLLPGVEGRYFVDSAPVLEHAFARNAGLGWIGKNSLLINREFGSYFFIGEIIIDRELECSEPSVKDLCGNCNLCVNECPTGAINNDRTINANRCISYLTIENKDEIPDEFAGSFYDRVFGCDICQDVCPWNRKLTPHSVRELNPAPGLLSMTKEEWISLDEDKFNQLFGGSAVKRTGFDGLKRNIAFLE